MRFIFALTLLAAMQPAMPSAGLEELWQYDTGCGLPHLPVVMNFDGVAGRCIYVSSRLSNDIQVVKADGELAATFPRPRRVTAGIACNSVLDQLVFEESGGRLVLLNRLRSESYIIDADGMPARGGGGLAFADINSDGLPEVLRANDQGVLCAYNRRMVPQWQYYAGQPLCGGIAAGPVFEDSCGVYLASRDGAVHGLTGEGRPLWRRQLPSRRFNPGPYRRPLVLEGDGAVPPLVVMTGGEGTVYALRADDGELVWETRVGRSDAGTPAVVVRENGGRVLVAVCEEGATATLDLHGDVVARGTLPAGRYIPRPLAADIDDDGNIETLTATTDGAIVVAALDGAVKERVALPGVAWQGMILSDIDRDLRLELISVTDGGMVACHKTLATAGWTHPAGNPALNGFANVEGVRGLKLPLPGEERTRRSVRVSSVTVRDFVENSPYGGAFVLARLTHKTATASAVVRRDGKIVGATFKPVEDDGLYIPFVQTTSEPVTLDLKLYNSSRKLLASSSNVPITPKPMRLVRLNPLESFLEAVGERAEAFRVPPEWQPPTIAGKTYWDLSMPGSRESNGQKAGRAVETVKARAMQSPFCKTGDSTRCAPLNWALMRGASRRNGGKPWGVDLCEGTGEPSYGNDWQRRAGTPPNLGLRLQTAAYLSGATFLDRRGCDSSGGFWYGGDRGAPYTPIAFMLSAGEGWRPDTAGAVETAGGAVEAMMRQAYGWRDYGDAQAGPLACGPYGDIFDILVTGSDAGNVGNYPVLWPLGGVDVKKAGVKALVRYVKNGGILVADVPLAERLRKHIPGVQFTRKTAVGTQVQTALAATGPVDAPFVYHVMEARDAHALAWTDAGDPLIIWRRMGRGIVIVGAAEGFVDATGHLLPVSQALLRTIAEAFTPIEVPDNFQVILNRVDDGWIVGAFNNRPAPVAAEGPANPLQKNECVIRFKDEAILRFTPQFGRFTWDNTASGLTTSLDPGEVAVVHVVLQGEQGHQGL